YAEVASNKVTVLVETAESADAIDKERAMMAKERAQSELSRMTPAAGDDYGKMKVVMMRAVARLNVASKG
ncbi:MAG: ATP synthase delta/epsilon chain alpha-helix domain-containing protein, partial [Syntrophales bacterium]|nr:ATP synthase delta/epsilon chain alpha-helix domain-containing protein [Syntrophales bacterium]